MGMLLKVTGDGRGIDAQEVRRALGLLADPLHAIQLQAAPSWSFATFSGAANGIGMATQWVSQHAGATGIYYALNPVPPALTSRVKCGDVVLRRWLLVDIDRKKTGEVVGKDAFGKPLRNSDLSATDGEHEAARSLAYDVLEYLCGRNWPDPLVVDSGNGFHLLYRIELPNTDVTRVHVKTILLKLARRFDDARGSIGAECYDARRISKLPGTWARRGPASKDRPHRMAKLIGGPA